MFWAAPSIVELRRMRTIKANIPRLPSNDWAGSCTYKVALKGPRPHYAGEI